MNVLEALKKRRAIRNYENREITKDVIETLLEVATWAPNDRNREPWSFFVIKDEAKKRYENMAEQYLEERFPTKPNLIKSSLDVVTSTPVIIVATADITSDDEAASTDNEYAVCCAIHSMWLAAEELGLGFVWRTRGVGLVRDQRLYEFIGAPENKKIIGTVFIGYPQENLELTDKRRKSYDNKTIWL
ncbi:MULTISPECIES: nitroreductase family protein [Bacillus]|uniref:nitroreductase family protein n=1 Tax=Bacillus TaxID=1386 RepID=UPI00031462E0|nr:MULTISPECIES: nitroreductase [Bacillus]